MPRKKKGPQDVTSLNLHCKPFIYKVLKEAHADLGISNKAMSIMESFINDMFFRVANLGLEVKEINCPNRKTLSEHDFKAGLRLTLRDELYKTVSNTADAALAAYKAGGKEKYLKEEEDVLQDAKEEKGNSFSVVQTRTGRAGLNFPVGRICRLLKLKYSPKYNIKSTAPVYIAAVVESLCRELLSRAGTMTKDSHHCRIIPRHILLAIKADKELDRLLSNVIIPSGGVPPSIHVALLPPKVHHDDAVVQPSVTEEAAPSCSALFQF